MGEGGYLLYLLSHWSVEEAAASNDCNLVGFEGVQKVDWDADEIHRLLNHHLAELDARLTLAYFAVEQLA